MFVRIVSLNMTNRRIQLLRESLKKQEIDALLISNFYNILYLTGFKTLTENEREAFVVVTRNNVYLITDGRYINNVKLQITHSIQLRVILSKVERITNDNSISNNKYLLMKLITPEKKLVQHIQEIVKGEKIKNLGIESEDIKLSEYELLKNKLEVKIISTSQLIIKLRELKDDEEINKIKKACKISDKCLQEIIKTIKIGQTEKEIAWKIESWIKEKGFDIAFDPIVAVDKNSAVPHYLTKEGKDRVKRDSLILIDFGVKYKNYCSDMTRMIFINKPNQKIINIYNKLLVAQEKTIKRLNAIKYLKEADDFCRQLITNYQLPIYPHSTGHGVGLEVHEHPKISAHSQGLLNTDQVFTIEPGIYFEGKWGIRIEDTVMINNKLNCDVLTKFPKQPLLI